MRKHTCRDADVCCYPSSSESSARLRGKARGTAVTHTHNSCFACRTSHNTSSAPRTSPAALKTLSSGHRRAAECWWFHTAQWELSCTPRNERHCETVPPPPEPIPSVGTVSAISVLSPGFLTEKHRWQQLGQHFTHPERVDCQFFQ